MDTITTETTIHEAAENLEKRIAAAAVDAGRGPKGLALNVAKTQVTLARGMLLLAEQGEAAVGSG